jgi:hypothetical protein
MWRLNPEMETWTQAYLGEPRGAKVLPNGDVIGFTDPVGVAIWKCDAEGVWQRALFREDWRDMENLTPLDNGRIVLGTSWMDEGSLRTDLEVIRYKDGELRDEATFTDKYGDADRAYFVLPDGHFAIATPR